MLLCTWATFNSLYKKTHTQPCYSTLQSTNLTIAMLQIAHCIFKIVPTKNPHHCKVCLSSLSPLAMVKFFVSVFLLGFTKWCSQKDFNTAIYYLLAWFRSHLMLHLLSTQLTNATSHVQEDSMHKNTGGCFGNLSFRWVSRLATLWFSFGWYPCLVQHVVLCFTQTRYS